MTRGRALGGLAVVAVLIAAAAFVLLQGGEEGGEVAPLALAAPTEGGARLPESALPRGSGSAAPTRTTLAPASTEELPDAPAGVPESYARALGGLTGRILEARKDGEPVPVPAFHVELVGSRASSILTARDAIRDPESVALQPIAGSAVTDAEGRFTLSGLEPRVLGALILDPGGPRAMLHLLEESPVSGETRDLGDIVLPLTATLTGVVVDAASRPLPDVRVRATDLPVLDALADVADFRAGGGVLVSKAASNGELPEDLLYIPPPSLARMESRLPFPTAHTDADGRFTLTGVPAGLVALVADDGAHRPLVRAGVATGAPGGTRDVGRLAMADGRELTVVVEDGDGERVPTADVLAGSEMGLAPVAVMKEPSGTGADGRFTFGGMADGPAWVAARAEPRHEYTLLRLDAAPSDVVTLRLPARRTLAVSVRDMQGEPVSDVTFLGRHTFTSEVPDIVVTPRRLDDRVTAGEEPGRYTIADLAPGHWELTAMAHGYASRRLLVDTGLVGGLEFVLRRGEVLAVRVVGALDGLPVEHARVDAWGEDGPDDLDLFEGPTTWARTDAAGVALLRDLPEGEVRVQVVHPAWAVFEARAEVPREEEVRIEMPGAGSVAGFVTDGGAPPPEPLFITLIAEGGEGDDEMPRFTLSDPDGAFRFDRVPPGDAELRAMSRAEFSGGLGFFETFINTPLAEAQVQVEEGREARVELVVGAIEEGLETGMLSGVLVVNGQAAQGWRLRTWGAIRRGVTTDEAGRFDLGRVEAGDLRLMINAPGQPITGGWTDARTIELMPGESKYERIDLATGSITGRVVLDDTGGPAGTVEVSLRAEEEQSSRRWGQPRTMTAPDGTFRFEPVVTGRYRVTAEYEGYAQALSEPLTLGPLESRTGVTLRLGRGLTLSGMIVMKGTQEVPRFVRLIARSESGQTVSTGVDLPGMTYSFTTLTPGKWTVHVASDVDAEFPSVEVELSADKRDQVLTFEAIPEQEDGAAPFVYKVN